MQGGPQENRENKETQEKTNRSVRAQGWRRETNRLGPSSSSSKMHLLK